MVQQHDMAERVAAKVLKAMAYNRSTFKDKVEEHIGGALLEYYKATLAKKNGQTKWVRHWMTEVNSLLDRALAAALLHSIRGFKNRRKALDEVVVSIKSKDAGYRRAAENVIMRDFAVKKVRKPLDDGDTAAFWDRVDRAVETALGEG